MAKLAIHCVSNSVKGMSDFTRLLEHIGKGTSRNLINVTEPATESTIIYIVSRKDFEVMEISNWFAHIVVNRQRFPIPISEKLLAKIQ